jgi:hypothetical protein
MEKMLCQKCKKKLNIVDSFIDGKCVICYFGDMEEPLYGEE